jgi:proteasome lid subunit RPN8/RPN11
MKGSGEMGVVPIRLTSEQLNQIRKEGEVTYPYECCGLLLGHIVSDEKVVAETYTAENAKEERAQHNRFLISPEAVRQAERYARSQKLEILGFYHSHPNAPARPSQFDLDHAWPFYSYVIVSVRDGKAEDLACWRLRDDRSCFDPEQMRGPEPAVRHSEPGVGSLIQ